MKRVRIVLLLVLSLLLVLTACGKSKVVQEVESLIDSIGEVTLESGDVIEKAENLYAILSDKEKASVDNRIELVDARNTYDRLVEKNKAEIAAEQARIAAEEKAARERAEKEAQHQEDLQLYEKYLQASIEGQKMVDAFKASVVYDLTFVSKYAGNVNGAGKRAFAESFTNRMKKAFDGIDLNVVKESDPKLAEIGSKIISNQRKIVNLIITMGVTNSDRDVPTIKSTALATIDLISDYLDEALVFAKEIETLKARIDAYE